ncbi:MAG: hypothetical protein IJJ69_08095 [Oscillospiraceae bacterium]|nr:hypothetical protein [Oscillospiraceae bacterium]
MNFKKLSVPLALLVTAGTLSAFGGAFSANADSIENLYLIKNTATGHYLTIANNNSQSGASVIEYDADGISNYNCWLKETNTDGQTVFTSVADESLALTVDSEGKLIIAPKDNTNVFQKFTLEGKNNTFKFTAGGWALTPDESAPTVRMSEGNGYSQWKLIQASGNRSCSGDVNRDGIVNIYDLLLAKKLLINGDKSDLEQIAIANVDANHEFSLTDIVKLTKYLHGNDSLHTDDWGTCVEFTANTIYPEYQEETVLPYEPETETEPATETEEIRQITLADMPENYKAPMEWIWQNRFVREGSTVRQNTIFDQIIAGKGTLNFIVRWQSYKTVTYEQRQQFQQLASDCVNAWNDYLKGYDGWPYDHIDVKVTGWAVIDKSCLLDLHDDEIVYDNLIAPYDNQYDTSNGYETIPDKLPSAPSELSRFDHFADKNYEYPGGLDKRFDMYLWCTQGFPAIGGCGGDWGQRLSDDAYLNMLGGQNLHVLIHEIGHGFGITDFYGGEGELDGYPVGGFPGNGTSIMMAGSSAEITDFDGWMLRYIWSNIKDEAGRF